MANGTWNPRALLAQLFGTSNYFIKGTSFTDNGVSFSIKPQAGEQIVGIEVDKGILSSHNGPKCDAAFFLFDTANNRFLIILVETKGGDVAHSIKQFAETASCLTSVAGCGRGLHLAQNNPFLSQPNTTIMKHGGKLLGVVVSKKGLPQSQMAKVKLLRNNKIVFHQTKITKSLTSGQLFAWAV